MPQWGAFKHEYRNDANDSHTHTHTHSIAPKRNVCHCQYRKYNLYLYIYIYIDIYLYIYIYIYVYVNVVYIYYRGGGVWGGVGGAIYSGIDTCGVVCRVWVGGRAVGREKH